MREELCAGGSGSPPVDGRERSCSTRRATKFSQDRDALFPKCKWTLLVASTHGNAENGPAGGDDNEVQNGEGQILSVRLKFAKVFLLLVSFSNATTTTRRNFWRRAGGRVFK
eukprot:GHVT01023115.1.p2 GENE.GHVT01023115.1~~GHVT01023115.1.p2  ORF type:complete len:112 (+),score=10.31 GHVT01023115.1:1541-1876(+)